ncbi:HAD hydrolase-like protein [Candidatus Acetothermia bacterium]|nr:HAD hydrolase-like protein [Candidatus Acetothermia bacterium]
MPKLVLFIDDGGVLNDNAVRGRQWQRLVGEFFPPILRGTPEAWAEANRVVAHQLWDHHTQALRGRRVDCDYQAFYCEYELAWLREMCEFVGVQTPGEIESLQMARRAADYITRRVRSACPGAIETVRELYTRGYELYTASGAHSSDLQGYLEGMGIRDCFIRLYGADWVNTLKEGREYYDRIFTHVGVSPADALVIDDSPRAIQWAAEAGARTVLVGSTTDGQCKADFMIARLAELPGVVKRLGLCPR